MKYKRYCEQCGKLIPKKSESWARYKKKKYCSNRCQTQSLRKPRETTHCVVCGKEFTYLVGQRVGKYCSQKCFHLDQHVGANIACEVCGNPIYRKLAALTRSQHFFCSPKCQLEWQKRNKDIIQCKICGKTFRAPKSHHRVVCSNHCNGVLTCMIQAKNRGPNKLEIAGGKLLDELGIDYQEQVVIEGKFLVDVLVPKTRTVIQWDGRYWHSKPKRKQLDKSQDAYMKKCGYDVIRFTDDEVYNHKDAVGDTIREKVLC